jgi:hypothetical protein
MNTKNAKAIILGIGLAKLKVIPIPNCLGTIVLGSRGL